jgi:ankyrin repeat protein
VRDRLLSTLCAFFLAIAASAALAQEDNPRPDMQPLYSNSLLSAAAQNQTDGVERMLRQGENPNGLDSNGRSPLGYAAIYGNTEMTKALVAGGARLDFGDRFGNTALHWAAANGQIEVLRLLLDDKAPIDAANKQGMTPLMLAADANRVEVVRVLLAAGADPKKEDYSGRDAIGWAQGKPGSLRLLEQAAK